MATQADLDRAYAWAKAQVGKPYVLGTFGNTFDCSTYMSGIATMIRDGVAKQWFTTHPFHSGSESPLAGWERDLEAPFMIGITADGIGHTGGTLLGTNFEATAAGSRVVRMGTSARGAKDSYYTYVYGFRPSLLEATPAPSVPVTYTLDVDDTLTEVASRFNVDVDAIATLNSLFRVGQELVVTEPSGIKTYVAANGDTWSSIAEANGISVNELLAMNGIKVAVGSSYIVKSAPKPATDGKIAANAVMFNRTTAETGKTFATSVISNTLQLMGLPVTDAWTQGYLTMALRESSYNPNAINTYDSNAINPPGYSNASDGYAFQCSRGMWQCIPQTFAAYHQAGTSLSIYDPIASCAASINYVRSRYNVAEDGSNLAQQVQQADPTRPPKGY